MTFRLSPCPSAFANIARAAVLGLAGIAFSCAAASAPALAKQKPPAKEKARDGKDRADAKTDKKSDKKKDQKNSAGKDEKSGAGKDSKNGKDKDAKNANGAKAPELVKTYGDWRVYTAAQGKDKTCYALASSPKDRDPKERDPKERRPAKLERGPAYVFISTRPSEGVHNEVAFSMKDNSAASMKDGAANADVDGVGYQLVTKGADAWLKNPAEEEKFVKALKSGDTLAVKSIKGKVMDTYSLKRLSQALERVQKECQ